MVVGVCVLLMLNCLFVVKLIFVYLLLCCCLGCLNMFMRDRVD